MKNMNKNKCITVRMWGGNRLWMITCGWICKLNSVGRPLFFHFKSKQKLFPDRYVFILVFQKSLFRIRVVFLLQLKLSLLYLSKGHLISNFSDFLMIFMYDEHQLILNLWVFIFNCWSHQDNITGLFINQIKTLWRWEHSFKSMGLNFGDLKGNKRPQIKLAEIQWRSLLIMNTFGRAWVKNFGYLTL